MEKEIPSYFSGKLFLWPNHKSSVVGSRKNRTNQTSKHQVSNYLRKWTSLDVFNWRVLYNYLYQSYQKRKRRNELKTFKNSHVFLQLCTVAWTLGQCFLSRGTVNLSAGSSPASTNPTVNVKFAISQLAVSGLKVNRLDAY